MDNQIPQQPDPSSVPAAQSVQPQAPAADKEVTIGNIKVHVNKSTCIGCGTCVGIAPNTFVLGADGKSEVKDGGTDSPETVTTAAQSCPTQSIVVINTQTNQPAF